MNYPAVYTAMGYTLVAIVHLILAMAADDDRHDPADHHQARKSNVTAWLCVAWPVLWLIIAVQSLTVLYAYWRVFRRHW